MAAASGSVRLQRCLVSPAGRHSASLIFLHGSGDSGQGMRRWIKQVLNHDLTFQHIKIIYPTAPPRPYTPMKGGISNVWFDRLKISIDCPEHLESIDKMCQVLTDLINEEVKSGINKNRILVGGFSMGGCMAMHLAYRSHQDVAGVFALSSFLNKDSAVYQDLQKVDSALPELFQCHGTSDELVLHSWGEETNSMLKSLGVNTKFQSLPGVYHELNRTELEHLRSWILTKLPGEVETQKE
ncbi:lysophospholipase-like protein 1 [Suncus etruscus]|uniref:lysophospholipase-like protein 1 n=1 Tax=Suncus etruscus TaxID=109475 RepID=UPI00211040E3|nr:lysophospholipase-like protein 1 [Suncus etruscus]XP_049639704.1 lysophospholipase-like protein 1 [Suncus etruscus]